MVKSKLEKPVYVVIKTESKPQMISRSKTINCAATTTDSAELQKIESEVPKSSSQNKKEETIITENKRTRSWNSSYDALLSFDSEIIFSIFEGMDITQFSNSAQQEIRKNWKQTRDFKIDEKIPIYQLMHRT